MSTNLTDQAGKLARDNQVTILGDTYHPDSKIYKTLTSPEMLGSLKDAGVKHIFLEISQELQHYADALANGTMSRDDFVKKMTEEMSDMWGNNEERMGMAADAILYARDNGMKVHFADPGNGLKTEIRGDVKKALQESLKKTFEEAGVPFSKKFEDNWKRLDEHPELLGAFQQNLGAYIGGLSTDKAWDLRVHLGEFINGRIDMSKRLDDTRLARNVLEISGGEKSVVIYGSEHNKLARILERSGLEVDSLDVYSNLTALSNIFKKNHDPTEYRGAIKEDLVTVRGAPLPTVAPG